MKCAKSKRWQAQAKTSKSIKNLVCAHRCFYFAFQLAHLENADVFLFGFFSSLQFMRVKNYKKEREKEKMKLIFFVVFTFLLDFTLDFRTHTHIHIHKKSPEFG